MSPEASFHSQSVARLYHFCYSIILPSLPISNILFILLFIMIAIDFLFTVANVNNIFKFTNFLLIKILFFFTILFHLYYKYKFMLHNNVLDATNIIISRKISFLPINYLLLSKSNYLEDYFPNYH